MKRLAIAMIAAALLLACGLSAWAADTVDVVYLKNGSVVRGQILEQIPNESVKIQTADGSVFVFKMSEIAKITKEPLASGTGQGEHPMKAFNLLLSPLGFIQFGPIVQLEFRFSPGLYGLAHVRMHGLGLLSHLLTASEPEYYAFAVGTGVRYFFVSNQVPHAPYLGAIAEFGYNPYFGANGSDWAGTSMYLTLAANGGYRWRFGSFIVQVGGYAGVSPTFYSQWHYLASPSVTYEGDLTVVFFGMLEVAIGWEL